MVAGPIMLSTLAAVLLLFVVVVAVIAFARARRRAAERSERTGGNEGAEASHQDAWVEAGRRAKAYPRRDEG